MKPNFHVALHWNYIKKGLTTFKVYSSFWHQIQSSLFDTLFLFYLYRIKSVNPSRLRPGSQNLGLLKFDVFQFFEKVQQMINFLLTHLIF